MIPTVKIETNYPLLNTVFSMRKKIPLYLLSENNNTIRIIYYSFDAGMLLHTVRPVLARKFFFVIIFLRNVRMSLHTYNYVDCT
jgi:hypothetical protein